MTSPRTLPTSKVWIYSLDLDRLLFFMKAITHPYEGLFSEKIADESRAEPDALCAEETDRSKSVEAARLATKASKETSEDAIAEKATEGETLGNLRHKLLPPYVWGF